MRGQQDETCLYHKLNKVPTTVHFQFTQQCQLPAGKGGGGDVWKQSFVSVEGEKVSQKRLNSLLTVLCFCLADLDNTREQIKYIFQFCSSSDR